jgi:hypothetical protein
MPEHYRVHTAISERQFIRHAANYRLFGVYFDGRQCTHDSMANHRAPNDSVKTLIAPEPQERVAMNAPHDTGEHLHLFGKYARARWGREPGSQAVSRCICQDG